MLQLSGSEELEVVSTDPGDVKDSPPYTLAYEGLMEVITCDVAKLNIEWPAEKQEVWQKSLLNERFLPSHAQPPRWGLPFFEVLRFLLRCRGRGRNQSPIEYICCRLRFTQISQKLKVMVMV